MRGHFPRITAFLALMSALMLPASTYAVSLGDELVMSRMGDPVEVEIQVLQWQDLDMDRVQISVGSAAEYQAFGLERTAVLDSLRFNLVGPDNAGHLTLLVSNREPIDEPFLELLMVMRWPGGSLLREYVLLFDPPGVEPPATVVTELSGTPAATATELPSVAVTESPRVAVTASAAEPAAPAPQPDRVTPPPPVPSVTESISAPATTPARTETIQAPPAPTIRNQVAIDVEPVGTRLPARVPSSEAGQTGRQRYQVKSGDSLWDIARAHEQSNIERDLYVFLVSLHDLNRDAFINGNISLLKSGAMLQIPSARDMSLVDRDMARRIFDQRWEEGTERYELALQGQALPLFSEAYDNNLLDAAEPEQVVAETTPPGLETPVGRAGNSPLLPASENTLIAPVPPAPVVAESLPPAVPTASEVSPPAVQQMALEETIQAPVTAPAAEIQLPSTDPAGTAEMLTSDTPDTVVSAIETQVPVQTVADPLPVPGPAIVELPFALEQYSDNPYMTDITANVRSIQEMLAIRQERLETITVLTMARDDAVNLANAELAALQNRLAGMRDASVTGLLTPRNERTLALVLVMLTLLGMAMILRETSVVRARTGYYS